MSLSSLANYTVMKEMGKGAYSIVYLVKSKADSLFYAMKSVKMNELSDKEKENAVNEIKILSSISHPNIVAFKESFFDEKSQTLNLVMEYADEGDMENKIKNHIKNKTFFDEKDVWKFIIQITEALKALHDNKIMHRDIKTANIFIKNGNAKLGDMNVSKVVKTGMLYTQIGAPYYASPEVWNDKPYEYKSDIWSMGCVLYEICSLLPPFRGKNLDQLYNSVMKGTFDPIPKFYSSDLANIISSMIKVNSSIRPSCESILNNQILLKKKQSNMISTQNQSFPFKLLKPNLINNIRDSKNDLKIKEPKEREREKEKEYIAKPNLSMINMSNSKPKLQPYNSYRLASASSAKKENRVSSLESNDKLFLLEKRLREESSRNKEILNRLSSARIKANDQIKLNEVSNRQKVLVSERNNNMYRKIVTYDNVLSRNKSRNVYENKTSLNPMNSILTNRDKDLRYITLDKERNKKCIVNQNNEVSSNIRLKQNMTNIYETHIQPIYQRLPSLNREADKTHRLNNNPIVSSASKDRKWMISPMKILPSRIYKK